MKRDFVDPHKENLSIKCIKNDNLGKKKKKRRKGKYET